MIKRLLKNGKSTKEPRFEYGCTQDAEWYFQLKNSDGSLLMHSDPYPSEEECLSAIEDIKLNSCLAQTVWVKSLEQY